jgi:hypothetical protein
MIDHVESRDGFKIKFYGANNIDAATLATSLNGIVGTAKDISTELDPQSQVRLNVISTDVGCFEINLDTIVNTAASVFTRENMELARDLVLTFLNILLIKKLLKGKAPRSVSSYENSTEITSQDGDAITVQRKTARTFFQSPVLDNRTVNIFAALKYDKNRDDVEISDKEGGTVVRIHKDEYEVMAVKIVEEIEASRDKYTQVIETPLLLKKPDLLGKSKWGFVFNKVIEADMKDADFLTRVQKGEIKNIYAGVRIPVRMLIEVDLDEMKNPKGEPKYTILEVTGEIMEPAEEGHLFDL